MSAVDEMDLGALGPYLEEHVPGFRGLRDAVKFKDGQSNPTFKITAESGVYVLRRQPPGELLKSAHQVDREFRAIAALADTEVPVPQALHLCEDRSVIGSMFYVMSFEDGRVLWSPRLEEATPTDRAQIYDEMNRVLAALHNVDVAAAGLSDFGKPGDYFERQTSRWTKQYRASETESHAAMDALIEWLPANTPEDDGTVSLIHGDYRLDNMVFHKTENRVIAVLDWELSTLGHPFADLAYQCMQLRMPPFGQLGGLGGVDRAALGIPSEEAYVQAYCERRGLSGIPHWNYYLAFSGFRLAAIIQGVYKRGLDGNASSSKATQYGSLVPQLGGMALEWAEKRA
ncbi:MAG: phosphotransferase [Pseudomonadota bacterium]